MLPIPERRKLKMSDMLNVKGLSISFGGLKAVNNFAINIEKGQLYGLIGPNGAGKTTIFDGWGQLIGVSACALFVIARADAPLSR